jgi:hypothetical protein
MIDDREMRVSKPCWSPRSKRMIATFGDGISTSTGTSLTVNQGIRTLEVLEREKRQTRNGSWSNSQDSHSETEPEVLLPQYPDAIGVPLVFIDVIAVPQQNEYPGWRTESDTPITDRGMQHTESQTDPGVQKMVRTLELRRKRIKKQPTIQQIYDVSRKH